MIYYSFIESPVDPLLIVGDGQTIHRLGFTDPAAPPVPEPGWQRRDDVFTEARRQLAEYFEGQRQAFELPLQPAGTTFQQQVWRALTTVPFGETVSYQTIAQQIGSPKAVRAVGAANGKNPIGIVVPCHRVIGSNGTLTGYAGGLERKQWLLNHEQKQKDLFS